MADEIKKRGRPKKENPQTIVNEEPKELEMKAESKATIVQVEKSLVELYNKALGNESSSGWRSDAATPFGLYNKYNPFLQNQRLKMLNTLPGQMEREDLIEALGKPQNKETELRSQGWSLSSSQYIYEKILRMSADIPLHKYYKTPEYLTDSEYKNKDFIEEDKFVDEWLEKFDIYNTLKRIDLEVKREGKPTYVLRNCIENVNGKKKTHYVTFQKMPSDYIKLIGIGEHGYIASFNMLIFMNPAILPEQYPDFIKNTWYELLENRVVKKEVKRGSETGNYKFDIAQANVYISSKFSGEQAPIIQTSGGNLVEKTYMMWMPLPQDLCYTFCSDTSHPWAIPDTSGMFLGLQELTDYDQLAGLLQSTPLTAILTGEMETIPNPNAGQDQTVMNPETIASFQDRFNISASKNIEAYFAPLKNFKLLSLPNIPNSSETSTNATKNFVYRNGLGGLLITTDKPSVTQIKTAQALAESEADFVTKQYESVLNMIINKLIGCKYKWKLRIWGGIFSFADEVKRDKELFISGGVFVLPKLASAYNMNLHDVRAVEGYVESLEIYKHLKTITQEQQQIMQEKNENSDLEGQSTGLGRNEIDEDEIDNENTEANRDSGLNEADARE